MLTKKTPEKIKTILKIKAQGVENTLQLTYKNHAPEKYQEFISNPENLKVPEGTSDNAGIAMINAQIVLFVVDSFDDGTDKDFPLTLDGLVDMDQHWPGVLMGLIRGYHMARGASVEKN